ncbi:MAG: class I SAM-dependent methyltransferase [Bacteroidetes bacterium QS_8_64_10]|nr:MAG: class I SAM-dependent methyltransferase [Bacteroidetes bacterium QS_8_64_10]
MPWYEDWFDRDEYELVYQDRDEEEAERCIDLIERTAEPKLGARIVDVGCGRGRHAVELARRGYYVTGTDLSEQAIRRAREHARQAGAAATFEQADMRETHCDECADGVVNLFTAFGYFADDDDHFRAIREMAAALHPGGWLFQDFLNAPQVERTLVPKDERTADGYRIRQQRWIAEGRINKKITLRPTGNGAESEETFRESVRLLDLDDFRTLYADAGLRLDATFGDYDGGPHTDTSPRLILLARKER